MLFRSVFPDGVSQRSESRVTSFWIDGEPLLLQFSSYLRTEGSQISAGDRLRQRIDQTPSMWKVLDQILCRDPSVDQAAGEEQVDELVWLHAYFVWTHLTVYATLSGPPGVVHDPDSWARIALRDLSLATQ